MNVRLEVYIATSLELLTILKPKVYTKSANRVHVYIWGPKTNTKRLHILTMDAGKANLKKNLFYPFSVTVYLKIFKLTFLLSKRVSVKQL